MNFLALLVSGDSKKIGLWLLLAGGAVALYLGWQYVQANKQAQGAAANLDAQGAAVQNEIASQLEQSQLSQQLSSLFPGTTDAVTSSPTGVAVLPLATTGSTTGTLVGVVGNNSAGFSGSGSGTAATAVPLNPPQNV